MPLHTKPAVAKPRQEAAARREAPSVDIPQLLASEKTAALGNTLMQVDIEQGNANGRLDYLELPKLDAATRRAVAQMMTAPAPTSPTVSAAAAVATVPAEPPGPLRREAPPYSRFEYADPQLLNAKGLPGEAFDLELKHDSHHYNAFVTSTDNLADPAMLRAHARFLELTGTGELRPTTKQRRKLLLNNLQNLMTVKGLDAMELAFFPAEKALAIVKRAAAAAKVNEADVLINVNGNRLRLPAWERLMGDPTSVPIRPYQPPTAALTEAGKRYQAMTTQLAAKEKRRAEAFFASNPGSTWSDYGRHVDSQKSDPADVYFWTAMEEWLDRAERASWFP